MIEVGLVLLLAGPSLPSAAAPVAALVEARDLLIARKFAALTSLVEARQETTARDPAKGDELDWTLNAFRLEDPAIPGLIEEWVAASGHSWASVLARAVNAGSRALRARGGKSASETSADQFRRMMELQGAVRADCRTVLSRNPAVCPCYVELATAARYDGSGMHPLLDHALEACPRDFLLNAEYVYGFTPRWGGSYEQMRSAIEAARRRSLDAAHMRHLEALVTRDRASLLETDGKLDQAIAVLDQATSVSPTALLLQERARMKRRRNDSEGALLDANAALELSHGGWMFSSGSLTRLLVARATALEALGRKGEARADVALALEVSPTDWVLKSLQARLAIPVGVARDDSVSPPPTGEPVVEGRPILAWVTDLASADLNARTRAAAVVHGAGQQAIPALLILIQLGDRPARVQGLTVLNAISGDKKQALPLLHRLLGESSLDVAILAAQGVVLARGEREADAFDVLSKGLKSQDASVASLAAGALASLGPRAAPAVPDLIRALDRPTADGIPRRAVYAIQQVGPAANAAIPKLEELTRRGDATLSQLARQAIEAIRKN